MTAKKQKNIVVGSVRRARVDGKTVTVKVVGVRELLHITCHCSEGRPSTVRKVTAYDVVDLRTGRSLSFRSAAKFRV